MRQGKIVCLGDSLTYGFPYGPHASWVRYAAETCSLNISNAGVNGDNLENMADRFDRDVLDKQPATAIILGGTNDAFWGEISRSMSISFMEQMVARALANGINPVIGSPIPVDDPSAGLKLERLCEEYRRIAAERGLPLLDFRTPFIDPATGQMKDDLYLDGVHPNLKGYRAMGETAVNFFQNYFK
jgi:acyl-CoA thioesterase-1